MEDQNSLTPKQELFLKYYLDPRSETFSNAYQSGIRAGFNGQYASALVSRPPAWFEECLADKDRLSLAEKNLEELMGQNEDIKVKADITKFTLSTLGRRKYSTRIETDLTSKGEVISGINYIVPVGSE